MMGRPRPRARHYSPAAHSPPPSATTATTPLSAATDATAAAAAAATVAGKLFIGADGLGRALATSVVAETVFGQTAADGYIHPPSLQANFTVDHTGDFSKNRGLPPTRQDGVAR